MPPIHSSASQTMSMLNLQDISGARVKGPGYVADATWRNQELVQFNEFTYSSRIVLIHQKPAFIMYTIINLLRGGSHESVLEREALR